MSSRICFIIFDQAKVIFFFVVITYIFFQSKLLRKKCVIMTKNLLSDREISIIAEQIIINKYAKVCFLYLHKLIIITNKLNVMINMVVNINEVKLNQYFT